MTDRRRSEASKEERLALSLELSSTASQESLSGTCSLPEERTHACQESMSVVES